MGLILAIHLIVCLLLIAVVLIQAGRGGGLVDSFSGVESMFGTKTNTFLTRTTTILAILFFLTCFSLALLSARQSRSLIRKEASIPEKITQPSPPTPTQIPKEEEKPKSQEPQKPPEAPQAEPRPSSEQNNIQ